MWLIYKSAQLTKKQRHPFGCLFVLSVGRQIRRQVIPEGVGEPTKKIRLKSLKIYDILNSINKNLSNSFNAHI